MKELTVTSLTEFTGAVETTLAITLANQAGASLKGNWYRGIGHASAHRLIPTLFRHPSKTDWKDLLYLERVMLEHFERQNVLHSGVVGGIGGPTDHGLLRALFYMQHYGVPTRLLDWTSNPFIALYFALSTAKFQAGGYGDDAAVWVLDPIGWNKVTLQDMNHGNRGPLTLDDESMDGYRPRKLIGGNIPPSELKHLQEAPAAMLGIANNARMFAQKGVFTIFGKDCRPMEEQFVTGSYDDDALIRIRIPAANIAEMIERLVSIGYTDSVSYPDLHGLAMEIKRTHGFPV